MLQIIVIYLYITSIHDFMKIHMCLPKVFFLSKSDKENGCQLMPAAIRGLYSRRNFKQKSSYQYLPLDRQIRQ